MTYDMVFAIVNCVGRLMLTGILVIGVHWFADRMIGIERLGAGLMAGSSFLTIAPILDVNQHGTPFDGWAALLLSTGCIMLFSGRIYRFWKHEIRNKAANDQARDWLMMKGKL